MNQLRHSFAVCGLLLGAPVTLWAVEPSPIDFAQDVQPILTRNCDRCHGSRNQEAGLQLNLRESVLATADSGEKIVVEHDPAASLLIKRISSDAHGDVMPIDGRPLSVREVDILRRWIEQGAQWPDSLSTPQHWAYQPIVRPEVPPPYSATEVDYFIDRRRDSRGLAAAPTLDRRRLIRRVSLALTGIPPTPKAVDDFVNDSSPTAYERVVDALLQSPRYGERWAVPWLDAARYADSNGFQADQIRENWAYRDWVIRAFNDDMPIDQFVVDQVAGDLHDDPTADQRIATGFHRMTTCNVEAGVHPEANRVNQVVDRVNTTATVFLGTTLECAQCHDHKYDPFSQSDYYRFFAYFNNTPLEVKNTEGVTWDFYGPAMTLASSESKTRDRATAQDQWERLTTDRRQLVAESEPDFQQWLAKRSEASEENKNIERLRAVFEKRHPPLKEIDQQIAAAKATVDRLAPVTTLVMVEMPEPRETFVMIRGNYEDLGDPVEPGTPANLPAVVSGGKADRMDLARWLTSPGNPLLSRVLVNRWWAELFGRGIVSTLEDFGTQGDTPSHPQLLDWLASELMGSGWSMKQTHKRMVMSQAFQQSARVTADLLRTDPENRWLTRGPRFRLPAELVRDNALAISGLLSDEMFGPPVMPYQPAGIWRSVGRNQPTWKTASNDQRFRRGVYVVWKRAAPYPSFVNFDAPNRGSCTVGRDRSNTPLQALTLLNDPAYAEMAYALADRILDQSPEKADAARINYAMQLACSRPASEQEIQVLRQLLDQERQALTSDPAVVSHRTKSLTTKTKAEAAELAAWFAVANALLNLDEVISQ